MKTVFSTAGGLRAPRIRNEVGLPGIQPDPGGMPDAAAETNDLARRGPGTGFAVRGNSRIDKAPPSDRSADNLNPLAAAPVFRRSGGGRDPVEAGIRWRQGSGFGKPWLVDFRRQNVDAAAIAIKSHGAVYQREQRVVLALADIATGVKLVAALPNKYIPGPHRLAAKMLDAPPLRVGIAAVSTGTLTLLVSHDTP